MTAKRWRLGLACLLVNLLLPTHAAAQAPVQTETPGGQMGTGGNSPFLTIEAGLGLAHPTGELYPPPFEPEDQHPIAYTTRVRYFQPFGHEQTRYGLQLGARHWNLPHQRHTQFDAAAVIRWTPALQVQVFGSVAHARTSNLRSGAALGQAGIGLDWILWQNPFHSDDGKSDSGPSSPGDFGGKLGVFVATPVGGEKRAPSVFERFGAAPLLTRGFRQVGVNGQFSWRHWGWMENPVIDLNYTHLTQPGRADSNFLSEIYSNTSFDRYRSQHAGSARFTAPASGRMSILVEVSVNPALVRGDGTSTQFMFGVRFGAWPLPVQFRGQARATPVELPSVRYGLLNEGGPSR